MEYAANVSMVVVGFFEVYTIAYIYGSFDFFKAIETKEKSVEKDAPVGNTVLLFPENSIMDIRIFSDVDTLPS
jgi:hypothetical protein